MVKLKSARAKGRQSSHPGPVPNVEQEAICETIQRIVDAEIDDVKVFDMSTYSSRKRSQQLCAKGVG